MTKICLDCGRLYNGGARQMYCPECQRKRKALSQSKWRNGGKSKAKEKSIAMDETQCRSCEYGLRGLYLYTNHYACDYYDRTGQLRDCEPSPHCTNYKLRKEG